MLKKIFRNLSDGQRGMLLGASLVGTFLLGRVTAPAPDLLTLLEAHRIAAFVQQSFWDDAERAVRESGSEEGLRVEISTIRRVARASYERLNCQGDETVPRDLDCSEIAEILFDWIDEHTR